MSRWLVWRVVYFFLLCYESSPLNERKVTIKQKLDKGIYLPSAEISTGFLVVADATVQPNVGVICVVLFGSDVVGRDLCEHQSLFDLKGSNLLFMMTCFNVIIYYEVF